MRNLKFGRSESRSLRSGRAVSLWTGHFPAVTLGVLATKLRSEFALPMLRAFRIFAEAKSPRKRPIFDVLSLLLFFFFFITSQIFKASQTCWFAWVFCTFKCCTNTVTTFRCPALNILKLLFQTDSLSTQILTMLHFIVPAFKLSCPKSLCSLLCVRVFVCEGEIIFRA